MYVNRTLTNITAAREGYAAMTRSPRKCAEKENGRPHFAHKSICNITSVKTAAANRYRIRSARVKACGTA